MAEPSTPYSDSVTSTLVHSNSPFLYVLKHIQYHHCVTHSIHECALTDLNHPVSNGLAEPSDQTQKLPEIVKT